MAGSKMCSKQREYLGWKPKLQVLPSPPMHLLSFTLLPLALAGHFGRHRRRRRRPQLAGKATWALIKSHHGTFRRISMFNHQFQLLQGNRPQKHHQHPTSVPHAVAMGNWWKLHPYFWCWGMDAIFEATWRSCIGYIGLGAWGSSDLPINQALSSGWPQTQPAHCN